MELLKIPIFKKVVELYKILNETRRVVPRQDRFTIWQKCENDTLEIIKQILSLASLSNKEKEVELKKTSCQLNILRILFRICKETKTIDNKKYIIIEQIVDEIGRMLGGWIKSVENSTKQTPS